MRISYMLELVLAVCFGLALARSRLCDPHWVEFHVTHAKDDINALIAQFEEGIGCVLAGTAFVTGLGTFIERERGKSPTKWGFGRWTLASLYVYMAVSYLVEVIDTAVRNYRSSHLHSLFIVIERLNRNYFYDFVPQEVTLFLLALGIVSLAAPARPRETADAREWTGRAVATALVTAWIVFRGLILSGF